MSDSAYAHDVPADLRVYTRNGSYVVSGEAVKHLNKALHPSEAEGIFCRLADHVPRHARCEIWLKCSDR